MIAIGITQMKEVKQTKKCEASDDYDGGEEGYEVISTISKNIKYCITFVLRKLIVCKQ